MAIFNDFVISALPHQSEPTETNSSINQAEQDDSSNIDLDTRIAMMFKEKSFGAAPPFLQLDDSESDTEKDTNHREQTDVDMIDESTSKSGIDKMVKSETAQIEQRKIKVEKSNCDDASDISSDDEILLKEADAIRAKLKLVDAKADDDRMSLSSLSSTDEKVSVKQLSGEMASGSSSAQPPMPSTNDGYYRASDEAPYYYANGTNSSYNPYGNQYSMPHGYMQPYISGFAGLIPGSYNVPADELAGNSSAAPPSPETVNKKDPNELKVKAVIDRVIKELRQILKKDFNKRMIEIIAYKQFEAWWDEQVRRDKNKSNEPIEPIVEKVVKAPDLNQVLAPSNNRENDYNGLGLGLRTQILKLPRFQRIRKLPSPVRQDEDSKKGLSDQEDIVHDSDSEVVIDAPKSKSTFNEKLKENESKMERKRKGGSVSSFFTSSSEENSSSAESDSELDTSSLSDMDDFESKASFYYPPPLSPPVLLLGIFRSILFKF